MSADLKYLYISRLFYAVDHFFKNISSLCINSDSMLAYNITLIRTPEIGSILTNTYQDGHCIDFLLSQFAWENKPISSFFEPFLYVLEPLQNKLNK